MPDPTDRERQKLWGRALADALKYALYRTRNPSRAEEIAADAVAAALDPERSLWDATSRKTPSQHCVNLVRERLKAEAEKKKVRDKPVYARAVDDEMRRAVPRPDARICATEKLAQGDSRWRAVREGLDGFAQEVLDRFGEGLTAAEQAARLGVDVGKIYEARRRIAERIRGLSDDDTGDGADSADAYLPDGDDEGGADTQEDGEGEVET